MFNRIRRKSKPLPREVRQAMADPEFQKKVRDLMLASRPVEDSEKSNAKSEK